LAAVALLVSGCTSGSTTPTAAPPPPTDPILLAADAPSGHITWDVSALPPESQAEARRVAQDSLKFYQEHIGAPWHDMRVAIVVVQMGVGGEFVADDKDCEQLNPRLTIRLPSASIDDIRWAVPHEVAHALLGCAGGPGRFEEARAEALSQMYHASIKAGNLGFDA
jgi:hypothetical protein